MKIIVLYGRTVLYGNDNIYFPDSEYFVKIKKMLLNVSKIDTRFLRDRNMLRSLWFVNCDKIK